MSLLLQLNGELPERFPTHERRIYVFGCRKASCRRRDGTVRALRGLRVWKEEEAKPEQEEKKEEPKVEETKPAQGLGDALFGGKSAGGNPFATNPFASGPAAATPKAEKPKAEEKSTASLNKTFAETLSLNATPSDPPPPPEPWPAELPQPYTALYLDADYETLDPKPAKLPEQNIQLDAADSEEPSALDREAFESAMDGTFQKFADRLEQNPDQVIRYEFDGTPLLYSKTDAVGEKLAKGNAAGMPGCPNCGGRRTFEVQLTPHAIVELEGDDLSLEGMEWGTIIVGVCERDCVPRGTGVGETGYVEEWAGVQLEELQSQK